MSRVRVKAEVAAWSESLSTGLTLELAWPTEVSLGQFVGKDKVAPESLW